MCVWVPVAKYTHLFIKRLYMNSSGNLEHVFF